MSVELKIPEVGESITEVQVGRWLKKSGDTAEQDEGVVEIETDKVSFEIPAPVTGKIVKVLKEEGADATVGEVIGYMEEGEADAADAAAKEKPAPAKEKAPSKAAKPAPAEKKEPAPAKEPAAAPAPKKPKREMTEEERLGTVRRVMPAARRVLEEHDVHADEVEGTGPGGRVLKEDVERFVRDREDVRHGEKLSRAKPTAATAVDGREEEVVPMSPLRKRVAERLVAAQQQAALLTTFNEIDMGAVMAARKEHGDAFREKYGVKLGFMSFFVKATIDALKGCPALNGEVRDEDVVYRNYYDIGVAVGGGKGLVVPVVRNADRLSFAELEKTIADLAARAQANRLELKELSGGTFTISNGGVYGSLLSTPIVNPPQSGILGLHAIQERPVGRDGEIVLRPMMYVALTYDHRLVDGREAVTFLKRVKDCVENPARMLYEI